MTTASVSAARSAGDVREAYERDGYWLCRGLFDRRVAEEASAWLKGQDQAALAKSWTEQEPAVPLAVFTSAQTGDHPIARMVADPRVIETAAELVGPVYLWASKVNVKAAWCGTVEYFHQDLVYWKDRGYPRPDLMTCMVFLEPHTIRNAALHVVPGTHRHGLIEHTPFVNINGLAKMMVPPGMLDRLCQEHGLTAIEGDPGDAIFFHAALVHGSSHNLSPTSRAVLIAQLNAVGNEPQEVLSRARELNLRRAELELREAERRLAWFQRKYDEQLASRDLTFTAPIPEVEQSHKKLR